MAGFSIQSCSKMICHASGRSMMVPSPVWCVFTARLKNLWNVIYFANARDWKNHKHKLLFFRPVCSASTTLMKEKSTTLSAGVHWSTRNGSWQPHTVLNSMRVSEWVGEMVVEYGCETLGCCKIIYKRLDKITIFFNWFEPTYKHRTKA